MTDELTLLAHANPVRVEDLESLALPESVRPDRRPRFVLGLAVVAAAVAASVVGIFAFGGQAKKPIGPVRPAIPPTLQPLADASRILGAPVVLPDTSLVTPADADKTVQTLCVPKDDTVDPGAGGCQVTVSFPTVGLTVTYVSFPGLETPSAAYTDVAKTNSGAELLNLGGVQALFVPQSESLMEFDLDGVQISIQGTHDEATLRSVAQSIVNRSGSSAPTLSPPFAATVDRPLPLPSAKQVSLSDVAAAIGQTIVLPDTPFVRPTDVGSVWVDGTLPNAAAAVTFPSQGVFIDYIAGMYSTHDPGANYRAIAEQDPRSFQTISLNGGTALAVKQNSDQTGHNFGGVLFVLNGLEIRVMGHYDEATLQAVAQSIIDRSK